MFDIISFKDGLNTRLDPQYILTTCEGTTVHNC